jgi:hypothetical protein
MADDKEARRGLQIPDSNSFFTSLLYLPNSSLFHPCVLGESLLDLCDY